MTTLREVEDEAFDLLRARDPHATREDAEHYVEARQIAASTKTNEEHYRDIRQIKRREREGREALERKRIETTLTAERRAVVDDLAVAEERRLDVAGATTQRERDARKNQALAAAIRKAQRSHADLFDNAKVAARVKDLAEKAVRAKCPTLYRSMARR